MSSHGSVLEAELQAKTVVQLKEMLRERGLKVSGRKAELITRLLENEGPKPVPSSTFSFTPLVPPTMVLPSIPQLPSITPVIQLGVIPTLPPMPSSATVEKVVQKATDNDPGGRRAYFREKTYTDKLGAFMAPRPSNIRCEGVWHPNYRPVPSKVTWRCKEDWMAKVKAIERYLKESPPEVVGRDVYYDRRGFFWYVTTIPCRLCPGFVPISNGEYNDPEYDMCWPVGYVEHYIGTHNVMPTRLFYDYVETRYDDLRDANLLV